MPDKSDTDEAKSYDQLRDRLAAELAKKFDSLGIEVKRFWKKQARDNPDFGADIVQQVKETAREKFLPQYIEAVREIAGVKARKKGWKHVVRHNQPLQSVLGGASGISNSISEVPIGGRASQPTDSDPIDYPTENAADDALEINLLNIAEEMFQRESGYQAEQAAEQEGQTREDEDTPPPGERETDRLSPSTHEETADKAVGEGLNQGREDAIDEAQDKTGGQRQVKATRVSERDQKVCDNCRDLDGTTVVVGSKEYRRLSPPAKCLAGSKCRCIWSYQFPEDYPPEQQDLFGGDDIPFGASAPEIPVDLAEGQGQWAEIFKIGAKVEHPAGAFEVTKDFAQGLLNSFEYLQGEHGYNPPLLRQHKEDGFVLGEVSDLRVNNGAIEARLNWVSKARELVEEGMIDRLSPSFFEEWTDPETGAELGPVLHEISAVSIPHLKSLPTLNSAENQLNSTYFTLAEQMGENMPDKDKQKQEKQEDKDNARVTPDKVMKEIKDLKKMLSKLMPEKDEEEGDEAEEMAKENQELREKLTKYELQEDLGSVDVDEDTENTLVKLKQTDEDDYRRVVNLVKENASKGEQTAINDKEYGSPGEPSITGKKNLKHLCEQAKSEGIEKGPELVKHLKGKGVDPAKIDGKVVRKVFR